MFSYFAKKLFGSSNQRIIKSLNLTVAKINELEPQMMALSDEELKHKTIEFKQALSDGKTLDDILPEAFAVTRETSRRVLSMRHFDVQLIGGIVLHQGRIAEMKTGEGKTLVATLAVYLNALTGNGVHVISVNDYLIERDSEWMGKIYRFLGLTVSFIANGMHEADRKAAYQADILYGTNNEFGFDYLRDNLKLSTDEMVQRKFNYAIVDEVDSILIDESRTPLIISGATEDNSDLYTKIDKIIPHLSQVDFEVDEKNRTAVLTDAGHEAIEDLLRKHNVLSSDSNLYDIESMSIVHHVDQALRAHKLFTKDVDYLIKDDKVMIIDEFTGRALDGRRYSEGLHQALEAKEGVKIQNESQTLASITFQNYFRMYPKLAGMTGTAMTEATEFLDIYKLAVVSIPTNLPIKRIDEDDIIYKTNAEKYKAIADEIEKVHATGQPILVGTISIEKSEQISLILSKRKIKHVVLNAKFHASEAEIIAQAGKSGGVTIATNMAGRGTDIKLGGNPDIIIDNLSVVADDIKTKIQDEVEQDKQKVLDAGGLFVLGTERHESRRIDNQLRGRSGRQGDPGRTQFYLSLEDDLMRLFGSERIADMLTKLGLKEDEAIVHPWISRSIEKAQQRVEARNYDARKEVLKYDDVMNEQRSVIYEQRLDLMSAVDLREPIKDLVSELNNEIVANFIPQNSLPEEWNVIGLEKELFRIYGIDINIRDFAAASTSSQEILNFIQDETVKLYEDRFIQYGGDTMQYAQKHIMLLTLDQLWKEHLHMLEHLKTGINLRAYAQKDPLNEYKMEAFQLFKNMLKNYHTTVVQRIAQLHIHTSIDQEELNAKHRELLSTDQNTNELKRTARNDLCPCKSGKKFKHCHGSID